MPVVFIHGVNNRKGPEYNSGLKVKTAFLQQYLQGVTIGGRTLTKVDPQFPYWGDLATTFAWNMGSLPHGDIQALTAAPVDEEIRALLAHIGDAVGGKMSNAPLLALAKKDFPNAVEVASSLALQMAPEGKEADVARFVVAAQAYAQKNPVPAWVQPLVNDDQFFAQLAGAIDADPVLKLQSQGLGDILNYLGGLAAKIKTAATDAVKSAAGKILDRAGDYASTKVLSWTRDSLNATLGRFFGDVFIYLNGRGDKDHPGDIPRLVLAALDAAATEAKANNEPLVVIGHSLGGVIAFDLLSHFRPALEVDLFVTGGSQVAHFEEMKLYKDSNKTITGPNGRAVTPPNIKHWINVYDPVDIFSYATTGIFDRVSFDGSYDTKTYVIKAHGQYFVQARFYQLLRKRFDNLKP